MLRIAIVGCTGRLGKEILKKALENKDIEVKYAITRKENPYVGQNVKDLFGGKIDLSIIDDIELAKDCDVFIDCTNAKAFIENNYIKYKKMNKPLVIATTAFTEDDLIKIKDLSNSIPIFMSGNFSVALFNFIFAKQKTPTSKRSVGGR